MIRAIARIGAIHKPLRRPQERSGAASPVSPFFTMCIGPEVITPLNISATSKTMWTLPPLWTHRTRPQGFGNLAENARFPQRPHRSSFSLKNKKNEEPNPSDQPSTKTDHPQFVAREIYHALLGDHHARTAAAAAA